MYNKRKLRYYEVYMEHKDKVKRDTLLKARPMFSLILGLTIFTAIFFITMLEVAKDSKPRGSFSRRGSQEESIASYENYDQEMIAVVLDINLADQQITLYDIKSKEEHILYYTGGSNITDKYGQVILSSQIPIGAMVDVGYQKAKNKIMKMNISNKAWEYIGVNNFTIDNLNGIFKIADSKYRFFENIFVIDTNNFIKMQDLASQDELTVRGYDETIWSIVVTRGHGTVRLTDYEAFIGGNVTIGYEAMQQILEETTITVREGNFNVTVENGNYSGTKFISILRNQETVVSLNDLGPEATKMGRVTFDISPFGADLFINGELFSYANPIELAYGNHDLEVSLSGYTSYRGKLTLDEAGKIIKVDLPQALSNKPASVTVSDEVFTPPNIDDNTLDDIFNDITEDVNKEDVIIDEDHFIYIQQPIGASVYLNGEFMGIAPCNFKKIIGSHVITFIMDGYETKSYTVEVVNDKLDAYFSLPNLVRIE